MLIAICAIIYPHSWQMGFFLPPASQSAYAWCILISYSISSHSSCKEVCLKNAMKSFQTSSSCKAYAFMPNGMLQVHIKDLLRSRI